MELLANLINHEGRKNVCEMPVAMVERERARLRIEVVKVAEDLCQV